jgi:hypothetical protein
VFQLLIRKFSINVSFPWRQYSVWMTVNELRARVVDSVVISNEKCSVVACIQVYLHMICQCFNKVTN